MGKISKEDNWRYLEYYIKRNPKLSVEECQKLLDEKISDKNKNTKSKIDYWVKNNPNLSLDECEVLRKQYVNEHNYQCIEYYIRKYPEKTREECQELLRERINNAQKKQLSKKVGEKNPNSKKNATESERQSRSPFSIEFYRKKYPNATEDELKQMLKDFVSKRKYVKENHSNTLEYYLSRGFDEDTAKQMLAERQRTFTLEKCISKYGEEEGLKIFTERQQQWHKNLRKSFEQDGDGRSCKSKLEIELVNTLCKCLNIEVPKKQKYISSPSNHFAYDFCYKNKIIEFNGDYWHCNPILYKSDYYHKVMKITAKEIWEKDEIKIQLAKDKGYDVLVVWESEYNLNKEYVIEKCLRFLNE